MESSTIHQLTEAFEGHAQQTDNGVEYWPARDLQYLLGCSKWENFQAVIVKAKTACEVSGQMVENHFPDVRKMVKIGSGTEREIEDVMLTRYACYLIAQNGDPKVCRQPEMQERIDFHSTGSTAKGIKSSVFVTLAFRHPKDPEQQRIAECLTSLDTLITAETQRLEVFKAHKNGLMQQLFPATGVDEP